MGIDGIEIGHEADKVTIEMHGSGQIARREFAVADAWIIAQEVGSAARQAQQHAAKAQAAAAGVTTKRAPKIGRKPED